jgi:beta-barrel assembly-enhancing protease
MSLRLPTVLLTAALALASSGNIAAAASPQQIHRSKSDANINAIGHRRTDPGLNLYSVEKEEQCGNSQAEKIRATYKLIDDPAVTTYIDRIAQHLAQNSDAHIPITVTVIDSEAIAAFTLPGGHQYFTRGLLLQLSDESELASVLARGIAHTALRSWTKLTTQVEIANLAVTAATPRPVSTSSNAAASQLEPMLITWQKWDEMNADYFGLQYVYKAGYDPKGFVNSVQKIENATPLAADDNLSALQGSLPSTNARLHAAQIEISQILPPQSNAITITPEFDAFKAHLAAMPPSLLSQ